MRRTIIALVVLFLGCGGSPPSTGDSGTTDSGGDAASSDASAPDGGAGCTATATVDGTMLGLTMNAVDAIGVFDGALNWSFAISDFAGLCSTLEAQQIRASSKTIGFEYSGPPVVPGNYAAGDSNAPFIVQFQSFDSTCGGQDDLAVGGTVTVISVSDSCVRATFDLTFGGSAGNDNEHVTGSVTAPACDLALDGGATSCK